MILNYVSKEKKNQYFFSICEYIYSDNSSILIDTLSNVYNVNKWYAGHQVDNVSTMDVFNSNEK